jgi:hypothetical protein
VSPDRGAVARWSSHRRGHMDQARTARSRPARTSVHPIGWTLAARRCRARPLPRRHRDNSHSRVVSLARRVGTLASRPPQDHIPYDHHRWRLNLELADLSDVERLRSVSLDAPRPSRSTWPAYQQVGEQLWREGWTGLIAPSAAHPGSLITCVFGGDWPPAGCTPLDASSVQAIPPPSRGLTT